MKTLLNNIKSIFTENTEKQQVSQCNYPNNYYGDQCCQS